MNLKDQASELAKRILNDSSNDEEAIQMVAVAGSIYRSQGADFATLELFYRHLINAISTRIIALEASAASNAAAASRLGIMRVAEVHAGELLKSMQEEARGERRSQ